ncbi:TPA: hypothetical protein ACHJIN_005747, partial [Escherichia coli]
CGSLYLPYNIALNVFIDFFIVVTPSLYRGLVMPPFFIPSAPLIVLPGATTHINCGWNGNTKNSHFRKSENYSHQQDAPETRSASRTELTFPWQSLRRIQAWSFI